MDSVIYRMGFGTRRAQARQIVRHGHIAVNGKKVTSPGFEVKEKDIITVREGSVANGSIASRRDLLKKYEYPGDTIKIIHGSALAALEGKPEGVAAIVSAQSERELLAARRLLNGQLACRLKPVMDLLAETLALTEVGWFRVVDGGHDTRVWRP